MSLDTVDDLHAAEDEIGVLRHHLAIIVARWDVAVATIEGPLGPFDLLAEAMPAARALAGDRFCRPSCTGRLAPDDLEPGDDGYLADDLGELCDPCCGCPCGHTA